MGLMVRMVLLGQLGHKVLLEQQERPGLPAPPGQQVQLVPRVLKGQLEQTELMEQMAHLALRAQLEQPGLKVPLVQQALPALKESRAILALRAPQEQPVQLALRELPGPRVFKVSRGSKVFREQQVPLVQQARKGSKVKWALLPYQVVVLCCLVQT